MASRIRFTLTREVAYGAGLDAGNRSMRKAGRKVWSKEDYNVCCDHTNYLLDCLDPEVADFRLRAGHMSENEKAMWLRTREQWMARRAA